MMHVTQESTFQSDEELMLEFKYGNQQAFSQLYQRYAQLIFAYTMKNTGGHQNIAGDITQEIWRSLIHSTATYEVSSSFKTYIFKITQSKIADHFRKNKKNPTHLSVDIQAPEIQNWVEDHLAEQYSDNDNPETHYLKQCDIQQLNQALKQLAPHHRQILLQYYGLEMSLTEIAAEMNVTMECAKSRLRYAKQQLSKLLED